MGHAVFKLLLDLILETTLTLDERHERPEVLPFAFQQPVRLRSLARWLTEWSVRSSSLISDKVLYLKPTQCIFEFLLEFSQFISVRHRFSLSRNMRWDMKAPTDSQVAHSPIYRSQSQHLYNLSIRLPMIEGWFVNSQYTLETFPWLLRKVARTLEKDIDKVIDVFDSLTSKVISISFRPGYLLKTCISTKVKSSDENNEPPRVELG